MKIGKIPKNRLSVARRVRDQINILIGNGGYAIVSINPNGYSVLVRIYEKEELNTPLPSMIDDIPIKITRIKKII